MANGAIRGRPAKQILQNIGPNNTNLMTGATFGFSPDTSRVDGYAIDIKHSRRIDAPNANVFSFLIGIFDRFNSITGDAHAPAGCAKSPDSFCVFMSNIFAFAEFYKLFARFNDLRVLRDGKYS